MTISGQGFALLQEAVRHGRSDLPDVAHEVGASAAQLGAPLHEVLDLVERAHGEVEPGYATVKAAALAWAEENLRHHVDAGCEDPLTSLATLPHLRTRLADLYRGAEREGGRVTDTHALVVVELPRRSTHQPIEASLDALEIAEAMRTVFSGDETVAQVSPRRFAALVDRGRADEVTLRVLAVLLESRTAGPPEPRLWLERLPGTDDGVRWMLTGLAD